MTRLEIITRLCEITAELSDISQQTQDSEVKSGLTSIEAYIQNTLRELQGES